ncbi:FecCD family ABC transporter permease [Paenibacillus endoradicis]|uniref:FecCD family ABC transporter permease n=1 Tax=Paenibacillus endoradicis TaxID=2972487 RepID=UPI002158FF8D|nr:iron ABC transporter permease [Paenibacillus endoradicis]MCR8657353.1 iron ABC transporter permease [Paenibacillus endoradicis]
MLLATQKRKQRLTMIVLTLLLIVTFIVAIGTGSSALGFDRLFPTLFGNGSFKESFTLFEVRLPRIIVTLLAGMALALSGSILQSVTRNDLADPGIIGIHSGAGIGVALFYLYVPTQILSLTFLLPLAAFGGAVITAIIIYIFSYERGVGLQPIRLILIGVGFSMALSGIMIFIFSAVDPFKVEFITKWMSGNIWGADWPYIWALLPWLLLLIPYTLYKSNRLNILTMSEHTAIGLGISLNRERITLMLTAVALAASAVSVAGSVAFIGLMAPHLAKAIVGPRHQLFMPVSLLLGGLLLLIADLLSRLLFQPTSLPAGIMVAIIGAPYFVYLLMKKI